MLSESVIRVIAQEAIQQKPYNSRLFPPSLYYQFLGNLAKYMEPKLSVVLGVCGGGDCLHMSLGSKGLVIGIDIAYDHPEQLKYIEQKCSNFVFHLGDSTTSAEYIYNKFGPVSLLFIDTTHTYQQTKLELEAWLPYLSKEYVVCFDDLFRDEMKGFWEDLTEPKLRMDFLHDGAEKGGGFGVIWSNDGDLKRIR